MTKYNVEKLLPKLQFLTARLKLRLNPKKTRIVNAQEERFDFLGFSFKKAENQLKDKEGSLLLSITESREGSKREGEKNY